MNISMANPLTSPIILPMDTVSCLDILVRVSASMTDPMYFPSISVISVSDR